MSISVPWPQWITTAKRSGQRHINIVNDDLPPLQPRKTVALCGQTSVFVESLSLKEMTCKRCVKRWKAKNPGLPFYSDLPLAVVLIQEEIQKELKAR